MKKNKLKDIETIVRISTKVAYTYFPCGSLTSTSCLEPPLWVALSGFFQFSVKSPTKFTASPWYKETKKEKFYGESDGFLFPFIIRR